MIPDGIPIGVFVEFKTHMKDADFWLVRSNTEDKVGTPVKHYNPDYIGVRVRPGAKAILLPDYLYYLFMHLHQQGYFKRLARGTLNLKHIRIKDLENITLKLQTDGGVIDTAAEWRRRRKAIKWDSRQSFDKKKLGKRHKIRAPWYRKYMDWLMGDLAEPSKSPDLKVWWKFWEPVKLDLQAEKFNKGAMELRDNLKGIAWAFHGSEEPDKEGLMLSNRDSQRYSRYTYYQTVKRDRSGQIITYFDEAGFEEWHYNTYVVRRIVKLFRAIRRQIRKGLAPAFSMPDYLTKPSYRTKFRKRLRRGQTRLPRFR